MEELRVDKEIVHVLIIIRRSSSTLSQVYAYSVSTPQRGAMTSDIKPVTGPVCGVCCCTICDRYVMRVMDNLYHERCLICCVCGVRLAHTCFTRDAKLYCRLDYDRHTHVYCSHNVHGDSTTGCNSTCPICDLLIAYMSDTLSIAISNLTNIHPTLPCPPPTRHSIMYSCATTHCTIPHKEYNASLKYEHDDFSISRTFRRVQYSINRLNTFRSFHCHFGNIGGASEGV
ncbi:hypothetical protein J6590_026124 [Homalodisca vitripennis]|nr:hypothetical protein J6590_026124 [Homalodisca vitripennis]